MRKWWEHVTIVFGENKANALALYNAINGTSYTNVEDVKITTIDGAVYIGMKNDVSILFDNVMSLYEPLQEYCEINNKIRRYQKEKYTIEEAVEMAVEECLQEGILEDILMKEKNRVISSLLTELTEEEKESVYTANGFEDGFDKGMKEGMKEGMEKGMEKGMERVSNLFSLLIKEGLSDDIEKALHDSEHLERLLEKYNV